MLLFILIVKDLVVLIDDDFIARKSFHAGAVKIIFNGNCLFNFKSSWPTKYLAKTYPEKPKENISLDENDVTLHVTPFSSNEMSSFGFPENQLSLCIA